jgi:phage head maturation protease
MLNMDASLKIRFDTDSINIKSITNEKTGDKQYYVEGYISTNELDQGNDIVTDECLDDMMDQLKSGNIKVDVEHATFKKKDHAEPPIGRIVDAIRDEKGIIATVMLNKHHRNFDETWGSLQDGHLDAFSITFSPLVWDDEEMAG